MERAVDPVSHTIESERKKYSHAVADLRVDGQVIPSLHSRPLAGNIGRRPACPSRIPNAEDASVIGALYRELVPLRPRVLVGREFNSLGIGGIAEPVVGIKCEVRGLGA